MAEEQPNVHSMQADIKLLQQGQQHIQTAVIGMSTKLDGVVDALTTLVRLTEKHDALSARVKVLEKSSDERESVASTGKSYMFAASVILPVVIAFVAWIGNETVTLKEKVSKHESHYENHR